MLNRSARLLSSWSCNTRSVSVASLRSGTVSGTWVRTVAMLKNRKAASASGHLSFIVISSSYHRIVNVGVKTNKSGLVHGSRPARICTAYFASRLSTRGQFHPAREEQCKVVVHEACGESVGDIPVNVFKFENGTPTVLEPMTFTDPGNRCRLK